MKGLKTWLRTYMLQNRFSLISIFNIGKEIIKTIDNDYIVSKFAEQKLTAYGLLTF